MKERLFEATKLLKRLEWAGTAVGQGSYMGSDDGKYYRACPICNGVHPEGELEFIKEAIGHKKTCKLANFIKEK